MRGILRAAALFVGAMVLQWWWNTHLSYWGAAPQFLFVLTILLAARRGPVLGMFAGFGWGLYVDGVRAELFGASALTFTLAAYFVGVIRHQIDLRSIGPLAVMTCLFTWGGFIGFWILGLIFTKRFEWSGWISVVMTPLLNALTITLLAQIFAVRQRR